MAPEAADVGRSLELRAIRAGYGETVVIDGIDLRVAEGESLAIVGRNGVGKSSLMATIMGLTTLHSGSLTFAGKELGRMKTHLRARAGLGYVPQEREVFGSLTVVENLAVAAAGGNWSIQRVFEMFPRLAERKTHRASQLSGGEQQMLAIGRALMGDPSVLLMDEPSEGLAPIIIEQLGESIRRLRDETNMTILLVEQHVDMALDFAPRVIALERGRITFDGDSAALRADDERMNALVGIGRH
jgi:branched-chain amino acid transport system ATP-binding protein